MKRDLATGRLIAPISTVCLLASYAVQSTLGDHDPDSCRSGYLEPFQVNLAASDFNLPSTPSAEAVAGYCVLVKKGLPEAVTGKVQ